MAKYYNILINSGTAPGPYTVYYDTIGPSNIATRVSISSPAINISYND